MLLRIPHTPGQPGIRSLFAYRPANALVVQYLQEVMRGDSPLSPGLRELIAALVSARNRCVY
jgi:alkylhydroperoxidase family enzyme